MSIDTFNFAGEVTIENMEEIAQALRERLTDRQYTLITENEYYRPDHREVRQNQYLKPGRDDGESIIAWKERYKDTPKQYGSIRFVDTYGVYCIQVDNYPENKRSHISFTPEKIVIDQWISHHIRWILIPKTSAFIPLQDIIERLENGSNLYHEVLPYRGLDISIHPATQDDEERTRLSAYIHIGGIQGNHLSFEIEDNEAAAHLFLGFKGIKPEDVEM